MLSGLSGLSGLSAVCGGAAAAFSPTQLSGYVNSPYNIALLRSQGKLWQDTAMTVAAVADGHPVRRIDCGGTYYDAPSDPARPMLYSEGGGKWSLSFDGVDDYVTRTAAVPINVTLAYGFQLAATASWPMLFSGGGSARELRSEAAGAVLSVIIDSHTMNISGALGSIVLNHWYTGIAACGGGGVSTELYQDGTQTAQDAADSTNADGTVWDIGARSGSYPWPGRMTGVVFLSRKATVAEVGQLNTYLAALAPSAPPFPESLTGYVDSPYNIALLRLHGKLYQNAAKTVVASADGDPVRVISCGATDYVAPSDAARPLLYSEGSGKWSLSFDGVDDYLSFSAATLTDLTIAAAFRANSFSNLVYYIVGGNVQGVVIGGTFGLGYGTYLFNGSTLACAASASETAAATNVVRVATNTKVYRDSPPVEVSSYASTDTMPGLTVSEIGRRPDGGGVWYFNGRLFGLSMSAATSAGDRTALAAYLAALKP